MIHEGTTSASNIKKKRKVVETIREKGSFESDSDGEQYGEKGSIMTRLLASLCLDRPPREIIHARKIYQTPLDKVFNINIELGTCVHGYLTPTMLQRASLLVFNVQLVCIGRKGTFNRVLMNLDFEDTLGAKPVKTAILAHAPYEFEGKQKVKDVLVKHTDKVEKVVSAQVELVAGELGTKMTTTNETSSTAIEKYYGKGTSGTSANPRGITSGVWWNVKKSSDPNAKDDAGIDPNYRFAVLVTRESNTPFKIRLKLGVEVANMGFRYKMKGGSSKITVKGESSGLDVDPRTHYEGNCDSISRMNLGRLRRKGRLARLASVV